MQITRQNPQDQAQIQRSLARARDLLSQYLRSEEKQVLYEDHFREMLPSEIIAALKKVYFSLSPHQKTVFSNIILFFCAHPYDFRTDNTIKGLTLHGRSRVNCVRNLLTKAGILNKHKAHDFAPCVYGLAPTLRDSKIRSLLASIIPAFKAFCLGMLLSSVPKAFSSQIEMGTHINQEINIKNLNYIGSVDRKRRSGQKSMQTLLKGLIGVSKATPPLRPNETNTKPRPLNGQQPKKVEFKKEQNMLTQQEKKKLSLPPAHKERPPLPIYRPYTAKPREIPHEDIYISYFKVQDHYRQNGNPLNLANPYRAKFIEMIEESCADSGISKTKLKQEVYKMYLLKKES